jgi:hypothetical protein
MPIFRLCHPTQPPTLIGCQILQLASDRSPACAFNQSSGSTFWSTFRLASPCQPSGPPSDQPTACAACRSPAHLPTDLKLAPAIILPAPPSFRPSGLRLPIDPPALPSNLTSDSHRLLHPLASPSRQPLACASSQLSGCAFRPASSLRLPPTFQPCLRTNLRLAPPTHSGLRLLADLQLAPSINLPARLRVNLPTCVFRLTLRLRLPAGFRLASSANLPALPSDPTSDSHQMSFPRRCLPVNL